jgi:hypothetical protein
MILRRTEVHLIDGTYAVEARTPLGSKSGTLVLASDGDACTADLTVAGKTKRLDGVLEGDVATFGGSVKLPFPFGRLDFTLSGGVVGDVLTGICSTKKFSFDVSGRRIA